MQTAAPRLPTPAVLAVNGGSSSLRAALFPASDADQCLWRAKVEGIGRDHSSLAINAADGSAIETRPLAASSHREAMDSLLDWLHERADQYQVTGVGHRLVHGLHHSQPALLTAELVRDLVQLTPFAPEHLPAELALIAACQQRLPHVPHIACFDTAFHRTMPAVAQRLPLPRWLAARGVARYGFHGLSYTYLMQRLRLTAPQEVDGRLILAHLGSGCSLAAVRAGHCMDTSMGFTPAGGLVMATRSGDLDPGVASYLLQSAGLSAEDFNRMINHESGLRGVSEISSDMRELLERERDDTRAAEAIELFCYQASKWIGAFAVPLAGLDTLVFAGGVGENAAAVRSRICAPLGFLGVQLDAQRNAANAGLISAAGAAVTVRVIHTDEERVIAGEVIALTRGNS